MKRFLLLFLLLALLLSLTGCFTITGDTTDTSPEGKQETPEEQPAAPEKALRQGDAAAVPQVLIRLQDVSHPGKRGLRRKGHHDLPLHGSGLFGRFGNGIFPYAVQVQVAVSPQLGAGVFRQRVLPVKCLSPGRQHGFGHGSSAFLSWFQQGAGAAPQGTALRAV